MRPQASSLESQQQSKCHSHLHGCPTCVEYCTTHMVVKALYNVAPGPTVCTAVIHKLLMVA